MGLSPYTRGNPLELGQQRRQHGSIPVHTGKPLYTVRLLFESEVYPRTHGETDKPIAEVDTASGLSPYTRGNRSHAVCSTKNLRSIPVHTGKPPA